LSITSANTETFSKFFHYYSQQEICNRLPSRNKGPTSKGRGREGRGEEGEGRGKGGGPTSKGGKEKGREGKGKGKGGEGKGRGRWEGPLSEIINTPLYSPISTSRLSSSLCAKDAVLLRRIYSLLQQMRRVGHSFLGVANVNCFYH